MENGDIAVQAVKHFLGDHHAMRPPNSSSGKAARTPRGMGMGLVMQAPLLINEKMAGLIIPLHIKGRRDHPKP
jgi:hypothetical protein